MSKELSGNKRDYVDSYLLPMLNGLQDIEIHDEEGRIREDTNMDTLEFSFQNWNTDFQPVLIKNGSELTEDSDYYVDYDNGTIEMSDDLSVGDKVLGTYRFQLFNLMTLGDFYDRAVSFFNGMHPKTSYTVENCPTEWVDILTEAAYKFCLQSIMLTAASWRGKLVFPDPATVIGVCTSILSDVSANIQARAQNIKGRSYLIPRLVSSGRWRTPRSVNSANWAEFTTVRTSG